MSDENKGFFSCDPTECASCSAGCPSAGGKAEIPPTITLTLDDDTEVHCAVLTVFPIEDKEYIALLPMDENGQGTKNEVYLYGFQQIDGNPMLSNIEDGDEYDRAVDAFNQILENAQMVASASPEDLPEE